MSFVDPSGQHRIMVVPLGEVRELLGGHSPSRTYWSPSQHPELAAVDPMACADDVDLDALQGMVVVLPRTLERRTTRELFSQVSLVPRQGTRTIYGADQTFESSRPANPTTVRVSRDLASVIAAHHGGSHRLRSIEQALSHTAKGLRARKLRGELCEVLPALLGEGLFCLMPVVPLYVAEA